MAFAFKRRESEDFTIVDSKTEEIVGKVRIKPSGVLWCPKGGHTFFRLSIKEFANLAEKHGSEQSM